MAPAPWLVFGRGRAEEILPILSSETAVTVRYLREVAMSVGRPHIHALGGVKRRSVAPTFTHSA